MGPRGLGRVWGRSPGGLEAPLIDPKYKPEFHGLEEFSQKIQKDLFDPKQENQNEELKEAQTQTGWLRSQDRHLLESKTVLEGIHGTLRQGQGGVMAE